MSEFGVVAIGRNEGERLRRCLESSLGRGVTVVYVDSGSTDGSIELAQSLQAEVVRLDLARPFTAARARNEGFERLVQVDPTVEFVQFIDGDCEIVAGWLDTALTFLRDHPDVAVVCGRRSERFPDATVYNRLADLEWDGPAGEIKASSGDAMMRVEAFRQVDGFDARIIAAEDDEVCLRIRHAGWKIMRLDAAMSFHDMAMTSFRQWWRRCTRTGHAYAEGAALHGRLPERHFVRQTRSALFWGVFVPLLTLALAWPTRGLSLLLLGGYYLLFRRTARYYVVERGWPKADARLYAFWIVVAKFPQALGIIRYWTDRLSGRGSVMTQFEYRGLASPKK